MERVIEKLLRFRVTANDKQQYFVQWKNYKRKSGKWKEVSEIPNSSVQKFWKVAALAVSDMSRRKSFYNVKKEYRRAIGLRNKLREDGVAILDGMQEEDGGAKRMEEEMVADIEDGEMLPDGNVTPTAFAMRPADRNSRNSVIGNRKCHAETLFLDGPYQRQMYEVILDNPREVIILQATDVPNYAIRDYWKDMNGFYDQIYDGTWRRPRAGRGREVFENLCVIVEYCWRNNIVLDLGYADTPDELQPIPMPRFDRVPILDFVEDEEEEEGNEEEDEDGKENR